MQAEVRDGSWAILDTTDLTVELDPEGYHVVLNGTPNGPLTQCITTKIDAMRDFNVEPSGSTNRLSKAQHCARRQLL